jgi:adenylate cyclase
LPIPNVNKKMTPQLSSRDKKSKTTLEQSLQSFDLTYFARGRQFFALLPRDPRCVSCLAPFEGAGATLVKALLNKKRSTINPLLCSSCEDILRRLRYGTEVEMSMLFADIRGSTPLAENMRPTEFKELIDRFYSETTHILAHSYAVIDKLGGDEVSGYYIPGFVGEDYVEASIQAAQDILRATGHTDLEGPWVPVGIGIHTGKAYFGAVSSKDGLVELTALGDPVNTTSRLASQAATGEIIISVDAAKKMGLDTANLDKRTLDLKGKSEPMDVWVMRVS